jgi:putative tricarboxylic transport membrane protein
MTLKATFALLCASGFLLGTLPAAAQGGATAPARTECLAGGKPGSGFDLSCRLLSETLQKTGMISSRMAVNYMEGGAGATVFNHVVGVRSAEPGLIVPASLGTALLLSQKKFGKFSEADVRWVGAIAADFGAIAVGKDSKIANLKDLVAALKADPSSVVIGGAGTIGSQDWMKAALVARQAGVDPKKLRFVTQNGGAAAATSIAGGHIHVYFGDAAELAPNVQAGLVKVISVLSDERLLGVLAEVPTAKQDGFDIVWPIWRGFYVGPKVSDAQYQWWVDTFSKLVQSPEFRDERTRRGLFELVSIGPDFDGLLKENIQNFKALSVEAGL